MRRAVGTAGHWHGLECRGHGFRITPVLVTLTYGPEDDWSRRHVTGFVREANRYCKARGYQLRHVWVAELTKAGRVHFHVVLWLRADIRLPKPDKAGWWPWGMTRIERARKPVGYLMKYASKGSDATQFPKGLRLHGRGGLDTQGSRMTAWYVLPRYQRERCSPDDRATRARGGGWVSRLSGEWWPPWDGDADPAPG